MQKAFRVITVMAVVLAILMIVVNVRMFNWVHGLVRDYLGDVTGTDPAVSWLVAVAVFALVCTVPWRSLLFAQVTGRPKPLITLAVASIAAAGALKLMNARFAFNHRGEPTRSFIETPQGRIILDEPPGDVDRKTGLVRQTLTPEVLRSITLEKKRKEVAKIRSNRFFSPNDGKPIAWFERGTCKIHDADGYDDFGQKLEPATSAKVEECNKLFAEAEEKRKQETAAQERRALREQQDARRKRFQEVGRYVAEGRYVTIDHIKFTFEECLVLRHVTQIKFRIANVRDEQEAETDSRFEFGLVDNAGAQTRPNAIRRVQGVVAIAADGALVPPGPGERGWIVVEFTRDSDSGAGFGLMINNAIAFSRPAEHIVRFRQF